MLKYEPREQFAKRVAEALNDPKQDREALRNSLELAVKEKLVEAEKAGYRIMGEFRRS